jgi:hypothetical protein
MRKKYDRHTPDVDPDAPTPHRSKRGKTVASHPYGLEMRVRASAGIINLGLEEWSRYWRWYATAEQRDEAMLAMNKKDRIYEYRPVHRGTKN